MTKAWKILTVYAALLASVAVIVAVGLALKQQEARHDRALLTTRTDQRLCHEIEGLKSKIRQVIRQSPPSGGRAKALTKFAPAHCAQLPTNTGKVRLPH